MKCQAAILPPSPRYALGGGWAHCTRQAKVRVTCAELKADSEALCMTHKAVIERLAERWGYQVTVVPIE